MSSECYIFTQTSNPMQTSAPAGFRFCSGPTEKGTLQGLMQSSQAMMDGEEGMGFHYSVGSRVGWNGRIPGPNQVAILNSSTAFVDKAALYAAEFVKLSGPV